MYIQIQFLEFVTILPQNKQKGNVDFIKKKKKNSPECREMGKGAGKQIFLAFHWSFRLVSGGLIVYSFDFIRSTSTTSSLVKNKSQSK